MTTKAEILAKAIRDAFTFASAVGHDEDRVSNVALALNRLAEAQTRIATAQERRAMAAEKYNEIFERYAMSRNPAARK